MCEMHTSHDGVAAASVAFSGLIQSFGYLDAVERGTLAQPITHRLEIDGVGTAQVLANPSDETFVTSSTSVGIGCDSPPDHP
jgi:hypothetical protein